MKNIIVRIAALLFLLLSCVNLGADDKDILKRVPRDFNFFVKLDIEKLLNIDQLKKSVLENKQFEEMRKSLQEKLALEVEDIEAFYICGNSDQFFEMAEKGFASQRGEFAVSAFVVLKEDLDLQKIRKQFPDEFTAMKEINGIKCIGFKEEQNPHVAFLAERLVMACPQKVLQKMLTTTPQSCILKRKQVVDQLMKNGLGGVCSIFHNGEVLLVPAQFPWLKQYNGASLNVYYDEKSGIDVELSVGFNELSAAKNASIMVNLGLGFLEIKPELKRFKDMIAFRSHKSDLLLDVKAPQEVMLSLKSEFEAQQKLRLERRAEWQERQRRRREAEEKKAESQQEQTLEEVEK